MFNEDYYSIDILRPAEIYDPSRGQRARGIPNVVYVSHLRGFEDLSPYGLTYRYLGGACCKSCAQGKGCESKCKPKKNPCCSSCAHGGPCSGKNPGALGACCSSCEHGGPCSGLGGMSETAQSFLNILLGAGVLAGVAYGIHLARKPGGVLERTFNQ